MPPRPASWRAERYASWPALGIKVLACEVVADENRYRLDMQLEGRLFVELDGYAYHWNPEQKRHDDARRNRLRLLGFAILVYDWHAVVNEPRRVVAEIRKGLRQQHAANRRIANRRIANS